MKGSRIVWLLLVLCMAAVNLLAGSGLSLALLLVLVLVPAGFLPLNSLAAKKMKLSLLQPANLAKRQEGVLELTIKNDWIFPICRLRCRLWVKNMLTLEQKTVELTTFVLPKGTQTVAVQIDSQYCGRLRMETQHLGLYDPFGIIAIPCKKRVTGFTTVQPDTFESEIHISSNPNCPDDSEIYSQEHPGHDLTEPFQIRDYHEGDSVRQVHWKLSQKFDRLIVRDPSLPVIRSVAVLWNRKQTNQESAKADVLAEVAVSVCKSLVEAGVQFTVCWNDAAEEACVLHEVRDMDDLIGLTPSMMAAWGSETGACAAELFLKSIGETVYSHILYITDSLSGADELNRVARVTTLCCCEQGEGAGDYCFHQQGYQEALLEVEI